MPNTNARDYYLMGHTIRVPKEIIDPLRDIARRHERSINSEVVWALKQYIQAEQDRQEAEAAQRAIVATSKES